jgi:uncharacterized protein (TIGR03435 family)
MLRVLLALVVAISAAVPGQAQRPAGTAPLPSFEAASIRPVTSAPFGVDVRYFPNRFVATAVTLSQLIQHAYDLEARELTGGPEWVRADWFDITATTGIEVSRDQTKLMLRSLLADRFQLLLEREPRTGTIYRLTTRDVRNLKPPAKPDERPLVSTMRNDGNGFISFEYVGHNATLAQLALSISGGLRAPVIDATRLAGNYDFRVAFTYIEPSGGLQPDPNIPTIFTALERDLGLKLEAGKGPVTVHVIRRALKPSAN